jgi:hypothetical protein
MPPLTATITFHHKISSFCELRLSAALPKHDYENLRGYMLGLVDRRALPPTNAGRLDWKDIANACDLDGESLRIAKRLAQHGFEAITRWIKDMAGSSRTVNHGGDREAAKQKR